jgi:hypothetical protein
MTLGESTPLSDEDLRAMVCAAYDREMEILRQRESVEKATPNPAIVKPVDEHQGIGSATDPIAVIQALPARWRKAAVHVDPYTHAGVAVVVKRALWRCADELETALAAVRLPRPIDTQGPPWWCKTCTSWRHTMPCGRNECPRPEDPA